MEDTRRSVLDEVQLLKSEVRKASFIAMDNTAPVPSSTPDVALVSRLGSLASKQNLFTSFYRNNGAHA